MKTKQKSIDSLNLFNDTLLITVFCLFCNQTRRFIYRIGEAPYGKCPFIEEEAVCMIITLYTARLFNGNHEKILQYYNSRHTTVLLSGIIGPCLWLFWFSGSKPNGCMR